MKILFRALGPLLISLIGLQVWGQELGEEIVVFASESPLEFSRNTKGAIGVDSTGLVHLVYGIPNESSNPPDNQIWYQQLKENNVSPPIRVDNGVWGGGRHASLAIDTHDAIHAVWQDYRHTTAIGQYFDNLEIYYDTKTTNGEFSGTDIRLTTTNAGHRGDNGYVPNISAGRDNRLHVVWYDFTINGNNADVYLINSGDSGRFPSQEGIESYRITSSDPTTENYTSNWLPDLASFPDGSLYTVWGFLRGWQGAFEMQGTSISKDGLTTIQETIAPAGGNFTDPPRLVSDEAGNLALVYTEYVNDTHRIDLHYKPFQEPWQGPVIVNDGFLDASQPCPVFLSPNELFVVWQENLGGINQIVLGKIDPQTMHVVERSVVSDIERDAKTPTISAHPHAGRIAVAWIGREWEGEYSIVLRQSSRTRVDNWILY